MASLAASAMIRMISAGFGLGICGPSFRQSRENWTDGRRGVFSGCDAPHTRGGVGGRSGAAGGDKGCHVGTLQADEAARFDRETGQVLASDVGADGRDGDAQELGGFFDREQGGVVVWLRIGGGRGRLGPLPLFLLSAASFVPGLAVFERETVFLEVDGLAAFGASAFFHWARPWMIWRM